MLGVGRPVSFQLDASSMVRGVRMIQNFHATDPTLVWPQVEHGDFWSLPSFVRGWVGGWLHREAQ